MTDTADVVVIGGGRPGRQPRLPPRLARRPRDRRGAAHGRRRRHRPLVGPRPRLLRPAGGGAGRRASRSSGSATGTRASAATAASRGRASCGSRAASATDRVRANVASHRELGVDSHVVDADGIRELAPGLAVADDEVAAWEPGSGYADPSMTAGSFMRAARDRGARLLQGAAVTAIPVEGGRVRGVVTTRRHDRRAGRGQRGGRLGRRRGAAGRARPAARRCGATTRATSACRRPCPRPIPVVIDIPNEMYFRPEGAELVLVGLEDDNQMGGEPDRETATAAAAFHDRAAERIVRRVPGLIDGHVPDLALRAGRADDDRPAAAPRPGRPGRVLPRLRPQRDGVQDVPGGRASGMAEWILDGAPRSVDLAPFAYSRGGRGPRPRGRARRRARLALISRPRARRPRLPRRSRATCSGSLRRPHVAPSRPGSFAASPRSPPGGSTAAADGVEIPSAGVRRRRRSRRRSSSRPRWSRSAARSPRRARRPGAADLGSASPDEEHRELVAHQPAANVLLRGGTRRRRARDDLG